MMNRNTKVEDINVSHTIGNTMLSAVDLSSVKPTDKICIVVFGNIASGKSTLAKQIVEHLPTFKYICLDEYRKALYDKYSNSAERERRCEETMVKELFESQLIVYETTASTLLFNRIKLRLKAHFKTIYVFVKCPIYECAHRFERRKTDFRVKPAFGKNLSIRELLYSIEEKQYSGKVHLVLNSEILNPVEMVNEFRRAFNCR